ncbi:acyltransferase family protein [Glaciihabitans sp. dw_435]|uniref:acyltransferase family protein n=1 Tax=Glaciihabitans sp. dw_435 TaxID=2720081 RepID=UPI001BD2F4F6|nr:acyltransferase family protein [Glaciihabitans sp. dw_435]
MAEPRAVRTDIQALRAVAVLSVVLYHFWPQHLPGGYVGVDVFFVISGYLITAHLMREVLRTGTISLPRFWARRVRRLLPASLLVLVASALITFAVVPSANWQSFFWEIISSAFYFENWTLAANSVDYLAANNIATVAQHFWSLSAEEQFYLVWPLLILAAVFVAIKVRRSASPERAVTVTLAVVTVASFVLSLYLTHTNPSQAYFITPVRAWEFGVGGLLALIGSAKATGNQHVRAAVSWLGLAAIAITVLTYTAATPFPGTAALLPVFGALAVLWAGSSTARWAPSALFALRPVGFVGDISYSLYLWHWPIIVGGAFFFGGSSNVPEKIGMLALSFVLAWLTKKYVEDPARSTSSFLARRKSSGLTFVAGLAAMCLVLAVGVTGLTIVNQRAEAAANLASSAEKNPVVCLGAAAMDPTRSCDNSSLGDIFAPDPAGLKADTGPGFDCAAGTGRAYRVCHYGSSAPDAVRIALVGDSHASMMMPAMLSQLEKKGWSLDTYIGKACVWGNMGTDPVCDPRRDVQKTLENAHYDGIVLADTRLAQASGYKEVPAGTPDSRVAGYKKAWAPVLATGTKIMVISDNPSFENSDIDCLAASGSASAAQACTVTPDYAWRDNDAATEAAKTSKGVNLIDLSSFYCADDKCPLVIGNVAVYYDPTHITATYSTTLGPYVWKGMERVLAK